MAITRSLRSGLEVEKASTEERILMIFLRCLKMKSVKKKVAQYLSGHHDKLSRDVHRLSWVYTFHIVLSVS